MRITQGPEQITAQVACEAIINGPEGFDPATVDAVIHTATYAGVADMYVNELREIRKGHETAKRRRSQAWYDEAYAGM